MMTRTVVGRCAAAAVLLAGVPVGHAWAADQEVMPPVVEDGSYPGADQIFAEYGVRLLTGDGGVLFTGKSSIDTGGCALDEIQVEQQTDVNPYFVYYCFKIVAEPGFLTLEVPRVSGVRGGAAPVRVTVSVPGGTKLYDVATNKQVPTDTEVAGAGSSQAVLLEILAPGVG